MSLVKKEEVLNQNISEGFKVIPNPETKRFVVKIPKIDESLLDDTSHVVDYKGNPTGINKGIIFHNGVDKTDQLVKGDGTGILIINNVTKSQSEMLTEMEKLLLQLPSELYLNGFKHFINECNVRGLIDKYNSTIDYMESNLRKDPESNTYVRTNDSMIAHIANESMVIEGADGTMITTPEFNKEYNAVSAAFYQDGLSPETKKDIIRKKFPDLQEFIVGHPVNKGDIILETKDGDFRKIDREVFKETYLDINGNKFSEEQLNDLSLEKTLDIKDR